MIVAVIFWVVYIASCFSYVRWMMSEARKSHSISDERIGVCHEDSHE